MTFEQTVIAAIVLFGLFILGYCKLMNKTLMEVMKDIINIFKTEI